MATEEKAVPRMALNIAQAVEASGVSRTTIYHEINAGRIRVLKIGDRTLIEPDELRRWLSTKRREVAAQAAEQPQPRRRLGAGGAR